jgi:hypothetical protein
VLYNGIAKVLKIVLQQLKNQEKADMKEMQEILSPEKLSEISEFC